MLKRKTSSRKGTHVCSVLCISKVPSHALARQVLQLHTHRVSHAGHACLCATDYVDSVRRGRGGERSPAHSSAVFVLTDSPGRDIFKRLILMFTMFKLVLSSTSKKWALACRPPSFLRCPGARGRAPPSSTLGVRVLVLSPVLSGHVPAAPISMQNRSKARLGWARGVLDTWTSSVGFSQSLTAGCRPTQTFSPLKGQPLQLPP